MSGECARRVHVHSQAKSVAGGGCRTAAVSEEGEAAAEAPPAADGRAGQFMRDGRWRAAGKGAASGGGEQSQKKSGQWWTPPAAAPAAPARSRQSVQAVTSSVAIDHLWRRETRSASEKPARAARKIFMPVGQMRRRRSAAGAPCEHPIAPCSWLPRPLPQSPRMCVVCPGSPALFSFSAARPLGGARAAPGASPRAVTRAA